MAEGTVEPRWRAQREAYGQDCAETVTVACDARVMTFGEVVDGWRDDEAFRDFFITEIARTPYPGFFWEMPPIARHTLDQPYEHVAVEGSVLESLRADPEVFLTQLKKLGAADSVASFANLSGDAVLVVPKPLVGHGGYSHLGAFLRTAPDPQKHDLLVTLARAIDARLARESRPIWISTAGLGVPWLHLRLDTRPKYYKHGPYRAAAT